VSEGGAGAAGRHDEAALLSALAAALERGAARAEPVSVLVVIPPEHGSTTLAAEAARSELPPEGLAVRLARGRTVLLLPSIGAAEARARAASIQARCRGASTGVASHDAASAPVGPAALLALAEAEAVAGTVKRRVLVVEDDPDVGEILETFLRARGPFEVTVARTGAEAIASARAIRPDAAVVDLVLPDADGAEVVARLREEIPNLLAVACSGKRPQDAAGAGFAAFHRKPIDLPALVRDVEGLLRNAPCP
jgi:CheY-like chemotaxis protein